MCQSDCKVHESRLYFIRFPDLCTDHAKPLAGGMHSTWPIHLSLDVLCDEFCSCSFAQLIVCDCQQLLCTENPAQACRHLFWKTSILWLMVLVIFQDCFALLLNKRIIAFWLMFLDLQVPRGEAEALLVFKIRIWISSSPSTLVDTLDPR